jgi:hypothetical protein
MSFNNFNRKQNVENKKLLLQNKKEEFDRLDK